MDTKIKVYKAVVLTSLLYGSVRPGPSTGDTKSWCSNFISAASAVFSTFAGRTWSQTLKFWREQDSQASSPPCASLRLAGQDTFPECQTRGSPSRSSTVSRGMASAPLAVRENATRTFWKCTSKTSLLTPTTGSSQLPTGLPGEESSPKEPSTQNLDVWTLQRRNAGHGKPELKAPPPPTGAKPSGGVSMPVLASSATDGRTAPLPNPMMSWSYSLSEWRTTCMFDYGFVCLSVCLSICLSVCLSSYITEYI